VALGTPVQIGRQQHRELLHGSLGRSHGV
jgi:hypothetical protein